MISFKGQRFPKEIILQCVRWYLVYSLSYRDLEEVMAERGIKVDHVSIHRWVIKYAPLLEAEFQKKKKQVGSSWRMDETYIKVKGEWKYLYRAVDKDGDTVDFLLTAKRDTKAALRYLKKAVKRNGEPEKITIDKSGANKAAANIYNESAENPAEIRDIKYLNNIVEQDHRGIKRVTKPMMGFKNFHSAQKTLKGIELGRMIKKGQMKDAGEMTPAEQFYSLAA